MNTKILFIIAFIFIGLSATAQTCFYDYQYTITPDGMKVKENFPWGGYKTITFSNNKAIFALTDRNGVANSDSCYRYSYSENGFNVYQHSYSGGNQQVNNLANSFYNSSMNSAYGYTIIAVSFADNYDTMLINLSNGSNFVLKRVSDPNKPNLRY